MQCVENFMLFFNKKSQSKENFIENLKMKMEDELPKEIEEKKNQRAEFRLGLRKKKLQEMIRQKRNLNSSNQAHLPLQFDEVKEEPSKSENGKLQLNQCKRFHWPKKKGKRCRKCKAWGHFKRNCP